MAVIRQKTTVFNQPVGVVRVDSGGQQLGNAISIAASEAASFIYNKAVVDQTESGAKAGLTVASSKISAIDPVTNTPVAYIPPQGFSEVQTKAYQDIIDRRFEESITNEIKAKGAELAQTSPTSEQYKERMSNHVAEMFNAEGEGTLYSRYIQESGESYIASTYSVLATKEREAAKAALILDSNIEASMGLEFITRSIAAGTDSSKIELDITNEFNRNNDLLKIKGISFSVWESRRKELSGYRSILANNNLTTIYAGLSDANKSMFQLGLIDPVIMQQLGSNIGNGSLASLAAIAKVNNDVSSLIAGYKSFAKAKDDQVVSESESIYSILSTVGQGIGYKDSVHDIKLLVNGQEGSAAAKQEVTSLLISDWIIANLDAVGKTALDIADISEALLGTRTTTRASKLYKLLGNTSHADSVVQQIFNLSDEERSELSVKLTDRLSSVKLIEAGTSNKIEDGFRKTAASFETMTDLDFDKAIKKFSVFKRKVNGSKLSGTKKRTIITAAEQMVVEQALLRSDSISLPLDLLRGVQQSLSQEGVSFEDPEMQKAYDLLRPAYEIERSMVNSHIELRSSNLEKQINSIANNQFFTNVASNIGGSSKQDIEAFDSILFEGVSITASEIRGNTVAMQALNDGVVLPTVARAIEASLFSSEGNLQEALTLFGQYSSLEVTASDGTVGTRDAMRAAISEKAYNRLSTIMFAAKKYGQTPISTSLRLTAYDGDIDNDIKTDLGISQSKAITEILNNYTMSSGYRREILSVIRLQKAYGEKITESGIEDIINEYTSSMHSDEDVVGQNIEGKTMFARNIYFSDTHIIKNRNRLVDAMVAAGTFSDILKGGNLIDATGAGLREMFLLGGFPTIMSFVEGFNTGVSSSEEISDNARRRIGETVLNIGLKYRPIQNTFSTTPTYEVGYLVPGTKQFEPIIINDQTWKLMGDADDNTAILRFQAKNNAFTASTSRTTEEERRIADIGYLATLPHMTEEKFFESKYLDETVIISRGDRDRYLEEFLRKRALYETAGGSN